MYRPDRSTTNVGTLYQRAEKNINCHTQKDGTYAC